MSDRPYRSGTSTRRLARTRGATSGLLLVALGAWGALIPFIGPSFNFAYSPDTSWKWTAARGWLEVLPGAVTFLGGVVLLMSASRITTNLGAWLGIAGGAWFIVGPQLAAPLHLGSPGAPTGSSTWLLAIESLAYFTGLGAIILFLGSVAFGRLSVVTVRDMRVAERREAERVEAEEAAAREVADRQAAEREAERRAAAQREAAEREAERAAAEREAERAAQPAQYPPPATETYGRREAGVAADDQQGYRPPPSG